jgi:hypothetical protein
MSESALPPTPNIDRLVEVLSKSEPHASVFWNIDGDVLIIDGHFDAANLEAALRRWLDLPKGSVFNPHTSRDAPRNPRLPVNYWSYFGDEGPTDAEDGDHWDRV